MITIIPYQRIYQADIEALLDEIAMEFSSPISSPKKMDQSKSLDKYWLAIDDQTIAGTVGIIMIDPHTAILKSMFVRKEYRGKTKGVSKSLLHKALDWCENEKMLSLYLGTMTQFKAAQKFYEKNGFKPINKSELPSHFIHNPLDTVFYFKPLNPQV